MQPKSDFEKAGDLYHKLVKDFVPSFKGSNVLVIPAKLEYPGEEIDVYSHFEEVQV